MPLFPAPELTPGVLFVCLGLFSVLTAVFAVSVSHGMPAFRHTLRPWAGAMLFIAFAASGFLARPLLPALLAYAVPNTAMFCAAALLGVTFAALDGGAPQHARRSWWIVGVATAALLAAQALRVPYGVLESISSLGLGLLLLHGAVLFWPQLRMRPRAVPEIWVLVSLAVVATAFVVRAVPGEGDGRSPIAASSLSSQAMLVICLVFLTSGSLAFISMLHERQRTALQHSYQRDSLTGLYTRGAFFEKAQAALQQAHQGERFAVVMVDLDHFKRVNDTYGHMVGDKVIARAARLLHGTTRLNDLAGRYGGEEFCVLLRHCDTERARRFAQRVMRSAEQPVSLRDGRSVRFSLSVGFLPFRKDQPMPPLEQLLDRADQALLRAKAQGRNRAVEADGAAA